MDLTLNMSVLIATQDVSPPMVTVKSHFLSPSVAEPLDFALGVEMHQARLSSHGRDLLTAS